MPNQDLHLALLGCPIINLGDASLRDALPEKMQALLCYLTLNPGFHDRAAIADLLWHSEVKPKTVAQMLTSLVVHLAHHLRDQFPDGVLWADVSQDNTIGLIDRWAEAYGCDFRTVADEASRAAALRDTLKDKQALLILDDVDRVTKVRPLIVSWRALDEKQKRTFALIGIFAGRSFTVEALIAAVAGVPPKPHGHHASPIIIKRHLCFL